MLPLIVMAAASILANKQKQQQERQQQYLDQLNQNADQSGGSSRMSRFITNNAAIDRQGADYSQILGLVGKGGGLFGGDSGADSGADSNPGGEVTNYDDGSYSQNGVQYSPMKELGGSVGGGDGYPDDYDPLDPFKRRRAGVF